MQWNGFFQRLGALCLGAFAAAVVGGCGGGVDSGGTGSSYLYGAITGFGSIIVNGVRVDDSGATVQGDDGVPRSRAALQLGVVTEIDASPLSVDAAGVPRTAAAAIRLRSELVGPVASVDLAAGSLQLLGQTVQVTAATVFDERLAGGLAGLAPATVVEVYARYDAERRIYTATRVEPAASAGRYKLRGIVDAYGTPAGTLTIGAAVIDLSGVAVPVGLRAGSLVRVGLQTSQRNGAWLAAGLDAGTIRPGDRDAAEVEGRISTRVSSRDFSVNGLTVDASAAAFPDGEAGAVLGARVQVKGRIGNGVLRAERVQIEGDEDKSNSAFELHGAIDAVDRAAMTFTLRGMTVDYGGPVRYDAGSAADLAVGRRVEVEGLLSSDGTRIEAREIKFEGD